MDHTQILLRPVVTEKATFLRRKVSRKRLVVTPMVVTPAAAAAVA